MKSMIEKVARAMVAADSGPEGSALFAIHLREFGDGYRTAARAAIEAMREPTDAMVVAGGRQVADIVGDPYASDHWMHFSGEALRVYRAMIDAALKETQL